VSEPPSSLLGPPLPFLLGERSIGRVELCDRCVVGEEIDVDAPHEVVTPTPRNTPMRRRTHLVGYLRS
jgi:hypothetical protein